LTVARQVNGDSIKTAVLFAGEINGPVETVIDQNNAMIFGVFAGLVAGLVIAIFKYFTGNK
jgi:hypothetical protein